MVNVSDMLVTHMYVVCVCVCVWKGRGKGVVTGWLMSVIHVCRREGGVTHMCVCVCGREGGSGRGGKGGVNGESVRGGKGGVKGESVRGGGEWIT